MAAPDPKEGVTYGDFAKGTARSYDYAAGAEHIGVIWSLDALKDTRAWLDAAFGAKPADTGVDRRGPTFAIMFIALAVLLRLGVDALPVVFDSPPRAPLRRVRFYALISAAAVATPLLLWKARDRFPADPARRLSRRAFRGLGRAAVGGRVLARRAAVPSPLGGRE